ncbi:MAG: hypothetical protein ACLQL2_13115 [Methylovirgula sp.]
MPPVGQMIADWGRRVLALERDRRPGLAASDAARDIMLYLGFAQDPSYDGVSDRRQKEVARIIERYFRGGGEERSLEKLAAIVAVNVSDEQVEAAAKRFAAAVYTMPFPEGFTTQSAEWLRKGIRAALTLPAQEA